MLRQKPYGRKRGNAMTIAVLIPCYNEAKTIAKVVGDYRAALPEADIYVYDNNSTRKEKRKRYDHCRADPLL